MTTAFAGAVLDADGRPFDRIRLTGLSATGHHGVFEHEKVEGQLFRADVVLHLDTRAAASGDDLDQTVSYAGVAEDVVAVLAGSPADLVETVAERIAATILTHDEVVAVDVAVHKPQAPITVPFEDVEVVIRRDRVVVPVVAPLSRRSEQLVAPIPVGSVAPALIHGVGDAPVAEERVELAPAPDVMPPSIPPGATAVPVEPSSPEPGHEVAGDSSDLDDERDATREAPVVPGPAAPAYEEPTGAAPAPEAPAPAPEPVPTSAEAPEQPGPVPSAAAPLAEHEPEPVHDQAPEAPAEPLPAPFAEPAYEPTYEPTYEGQDDAAPEVPVTAAPVAAAAPGAGAPVASSEEPAAPVAAEEEIPAPPVEHDRMDDVPAGFVEVVLALGANLGDAQQTLRDAITDLDRISGLEITEVSPLARTAAVGGPDQPDFLNTVLLARTRLSARDLLHACQTVEQAHGRVRDERWGPRTLDVDLIVYGTLTAVADDLELPHPRAHERAFVLEPWSQIDPDAVLPGLGGGPVAALAATAPDRGGIRWLALDWLTDAAPEPTGAVPLATGGSDAAPAPAEPVVADDPYRQPSADAVPGPHEAPSTSAPVGVQAVPEDVSGPTGPQHPPVPPHQALPQRPAAPQPPLPAQPAQPVPPQEPSAPGAVLPVAPPQAAIPPQAVPTEPTVARPVFAPVSDGVAPSVEGAPTVVPDGSFGSHEAGSPPVAPFPGPSHRPAALPDPEPPAQDVVQPSEPAAPAFPAFAPVRPAEPPVAVHPAGASPVAVPPAQAPADPADDGIIRSVPFAPVSGPGQSPAQQPAHPAAQQSAQGSAPGPLADASLRPATDPWPPFGPVSGGAHDAQR
ncbi:2-amino-4-hydroxy-6-hydroxymethyldihydropteridine diphosphokinase [Cellulosimicrobium cellulans]|uniref:2-amino-4-hydroxy-6- hydroxymethyldihydropteridine diphosphokinase n=1 Tax=Cellulosimicrobium cellulans TaxID=1710 RepID=UPI002405AF2A|nr:2-amino-4-hydroxy-6-hydroxymethyldihydropteridine diphosphokinase [Cellulosimicrobium cellulans]MDF9878555.1 dihydroneopterin aldolase/2-amino-4-hydroxy-6-hydroxymethyldihydropteridine diphosphokinase [Cellulosimicrobium cellulans]